MSGYLAAAGGLMQLGGTVLADQEQREKLNRLKDAINLAPLDTNAITSDALSGLTNQFPKATALSSRMNTYNADELNRLLEASYPGYKSQLGKFRSTLDSRLAGEISPDVASAVSRSTAGRALFGGYSGSGLHRNLTARDLGRTSMDIQDQAMNTFMRVPSAFPRATPVDYTNLMGLTPAQLIQIRQQERAAKQQLMAGMAGMGTSSGVWANYLNETGGMLMGKGLFSMGGGGGGGGGGGNQWFLNSSSWGNPNAYSMAQNYYQ